ncbi:MAG: SPOR domain-containing protein [Gammaproteobacteria bacterium]
MQLTPPSAEYPYQLTESLRQRLDLVHHLVEFGRQVIVVQGPRGSGRSRLLGTVADEAAGDWETVLLEGRQHNGAAALIGAWTEALGAPPGADDGDIDILREALHRLTRQRRRCVLLVDDADALDDDAVALLQAIANHPHDFEDTRVVLSTADDGEEDFAAFFEAGVSGIGMVHVVEVPPLDTAGVRGLAAAWSALIGLPPSVVLPEDAVDGVAQAAEGRPARVLEYLAQRLEQGQPTEQEIFGGFELPARLKRVGGIALVGAAALGLVALAVTQRERAPAAVAEQGPTLIELELPDAPATEQVPAATVGEVTPTPAVREIPLTLPADGAASGNPTALGTAAEPRIDTDTASPPIGSPPTASAAAATPEPATAPPTTPAPASASALAVPTPPAPRDAIVPRPPLPPLDTPPRTVVEPAPPEPTASAPSENKPHESQAYNAKWVLTQKPGAYVVQVFGGSTRAAAEKYLRGQGALRGRAAVLDLRRNGAPWHVVVWGLFPDRNAAAAAIATLPAAVRAAGPWPRSVGSLTE